MLSFKWRHFEKEIILLNVRWYLAYPLSYRNLEEIAEERGYHVDHSTLNRWGINYAPELEKEFHKKKRPVNGRWRMDETYIKVKGEWKYFYRAVDKEGNTIDFLLTAKRDTKAAKCFFKKAIKRNGRPELVNIDKSGSNKAALNSINKEDSDAPKVEPIVIRQCKYLNNIIEQDHRNIKRITRPRGVAIFAKACFGHPSPSKRQKLNATANAFGAPIRPRHHVPTQQGVGTLAPNDLTPCRMAFYFVSTFAIAQTPTKQPALRLSRTENLHFAKAPFPGFSAEAVLFV